MPFPTHFTKALLNAILRHNVFEFNSKAYRQVRGTAKGTKVAPAYANLFMARLEESFFASRAGSLLNYLRFIDDMFLLWSGSHESLEQTLDEQNHFHPTIVHVDYFQLECGFTGPRGQESPQVLRTCPRNTS
jgi:hypothetical protein